MGLAVYLSQIKTKLQLDYPQVFLILIHLSMWKDIQ